MIRRLISILSVVALCLLLSLTHGYALPLSADGPQPGDHQQVEQISSGVEASDPQIDPADVVLLRQLPSLRGSVTSIAKCCNECIESIAASKVKLKCSRCIDVPTSGSCESSDKVERFIIDCKGTFLDQRSNFTCYS